MISIEVLCTPGHPMTGAWLLSTDQNKAAHSVAAVRPRGFRTTADAAIDLDRSVRERSP